jgi:hypothetical protein
MKRRGLSRLGKAERIILYNFAKKAVMRRLSADSFYVSEDGHRHSLASLGLRSSSSASFTLMG